MFASMRIVDEYDMRMLKLFMLWRNGITHKKKKEKRREENGEQVIGVRSGVSSGGEKKERGKETKE